ncbi:flagellar biosynthetic protein FliR, partial [uncultured Abyssibacter sp.]|uniref:flagellar biosynthetic protein FliR n=1 Tax=uncultured Abyssibacter sp. TaxID=2320202 RepID=UPI0032B1EBA0
LAIAQWGTAMFVGALQVALPAMCALLLVNFAFGVMSRSAPALNVLSVGLPAALIFGLLAMYTALPALQQVLDHWLDQAMASIAAIYGAG